MTRREETGYGVNRRVLRNREWSWPGALIGAIVVGVLIAIGGVTGILTIGGVGDIVPMIVCALAGGVIGGMWRRWDEPGGG